MLFVLPSSSCCNDIPRTRRSTSASTGRVSQSSFVILQGFSIPLPDRDPVLGHSRSHVLDVLRGFGVARSSLRLASAAQTPKHVVLWLAPGLVVPFGFGLVADSGRVPWGALATRGCFLAAPLGVDSSLRCRLRLRDLAKVVSLGGEPGPASQSVAKRAGGGDAS